MCFQARVFKNSENMFTKVLGIFNFFFHLLSKLVAKVLNRVEV